MFNSLNFFHTFFNTNNKVFLHFNKTTHYAGLTTDENEESFVLEAIKEEPAYIEQPGTQRNTEQS